MEGFAVEVFATSWIEISCMNRNSSAVSVEVFATSWIEIRHLWLWLSFQTVEVFATSWIEILFYISVFLIWISSRSLRPRGLKFSLFFLLMLQVLVEVFATSWIEM